jgi:predicted GTPase
MSNFLKGRFGIVWLVFGPFDWFDKLTTGKLRAIGRQNVAESCLLSGIMGKNRLLNKPIPSV